MVIFQFAMFVYQRVFMGLFGRNLEELSEDGHSMFIIRLLLPYPLVIKTWLAGKSLRKMEIKWCS